MAIAGRGADHILSAEALRTTRYSDVCGGTDEIKRFLTEELDRAARPEGRQALRGLVDDGLSMLARMEERLREYQAFRDLLAELVERMRVLPEPRLSDAAREADHMRGLLERADPPPAQELVDRAEEIRQVANDMEGALRRHKEATIEAGRAYLGLKGARGWEDGRPVAAPPQGNGQSPVGIPLVPGTAPGDVAHDAAPLPGWIPEAWLPPTPHREKIVDWLRRGRAALLAATEIDRLPVGPQGREPWVQFEDGGMMPLRVVRWNEEVRNFHPLGQEPHPRSALYRQRATGPAQPPVES